MPLHEDSTIALPCLYGSLEWTNGTQRLVIFYFAAFQFHALESCLSFEFFFSCCCPLFFKVALFKRGVSKLLIYMVENHFRDIAQGAQCVMFLLHFYFDVMK